MTEIPDSVIDRIIKYVDKPHLSILDSYVGHKLTIQVSRPDQSDRKVDKNNFDIVIWNLKVSNRHPSVTKFGKNCSLVAYWKYLKGEGQLLWKSPRREPTECVINTNPILVENPTPHLDNRYSSNLGDAYTWEIKSIGMPRMTIPEGEIEEVYFLLTIKDHEVAYLIMNVPKYSGYRRDKDRGILVTHLNDQPLLIPVGDNRSFNIRFDCEGYQEERFHKFNLIIHSYDDIQIDAAAV